MLNKIVVVLTLSLLVGNYTFADESITITTYYPSPYGVYDRLQANRLAVGDTNNNGSLDAGDQPAADGQLYTARSVIYKPQASDPAANRVTGEVIYNSSADQFKYYNGSAWVALGGGGPASWTCALRTGAPAKCIAPEKLINFSCQYPGVVVGITGDPAEVTCENMGTWTLTLATAYCCK